MKEVNITEKRFTIGADGNARIFIYDSDSCEYISTMAGACELLNEMSQEIDILTKEYSSLENKMGDDDLCAAAEESYEELAKEVALLSDEVLKLTRSKGESDYAFSSETEVPF